MQEILNTSDITPASVEDYTISLPWYFNKGNKVIHHRNTTTTKTEIQFAHLSLIHYSKNITFINTLENLYH
jgi:hypothetical protein